MRVFVTRKQNTWTSATWTAIITAAAAAVLVWPAAAAGQQPPAPRCTFGEVARVAELPEGSGAAASPRDPRRIWTHNDEGNVLLAVDERGAVTARVRLPKTDIEDWEALAAGPCPGGSCLFVGDIGDNDGERDRITIYRMPEPDGTGAAERIETFHLTYPDRPQDAETLLVTPKGDIYIVTKGDTGPIALYRVPQGAKPGSVTRLERVGKPRTPGAVSAKDRITDGAVSPDGTWVVLRTRTALSFHAASDLLAGQWQERGRVDLSRLGEPQGEGVTFADASTLYLVGEGGGKKRPGTIVRATCTF